MKINLFNDKQSEHLAESVKPNWIIKFNNAVTELEGLLDGEIERQLETSEKVANIKAERAELLEKATVIVEIEKSLQEIDKDYNVYYKIERWNDNFKDYPNISEMLRIPKTTLETWNKKTDDLINAVAKKAAYEVLHLDVLSKRQKHLLNDLRARIAVMGVCSYEDVVTNLETTIKIEDYFQTL